MVARRRRLCMASVVVMMSNDSARRLTLRVREARVLITEPMESEDSKVRRAWGERKRRRSTRKRTKAKKKKTKRYDLYAERVKLRGLKRKKTYYVRVRAFKKVGTKKVYGKWSITKKCKVK